jgi:DNA-binding NtrC family response regulator
MKPPTLAGKRVLVVEDEYLVALVLEDVLSDAGCTVVGPFARVQDALAAAKVEVVDVALLDVNVGGEMVFPVAYLLEEKGTPFLFVTGYGRAILPRDRSNWEACTKPFQPEQLVECLTRKLKAS